MSTQQPDRPDQAQDLGRLDDDAEERAQTSTSEAPGGAAAEGEYDPAEGSPHAGAHPTGETFPEEAARFDEPEHKRSDTD